MEQQVLSGLKTGNAILKELQGEMRVEEVEELMADTAEAIAYQNEISAMLSGKMTSEEEEDVLAELEGLEGEVMQEMIPSVPERVEQAEQELSQEAAMQSDSPMLT